MRSLRKYVRNIIKEFAIPTYEEEVLPIPGMSYPIEIEDIVVDDVAELILAPEGEEDLVLDDILGVEPEGDLDPFVEPLVLDPVIDTVEDVPMDEILLDDEIGMYPYEHLDDDGRMFDYGHTKSDSHEGRMTRAKLYRMGKMAQSFHDRLDDGDDLPQWVNDKVTTAEDRLRSAFEYIDYKIHRLEKSGCACHEGHVRKFAREFLLR